MTYKKILLIIFLGLLLIGQLPSTLEAKKLKASKLPHKYRKWLLEEVVYIITPTEKNVFLQLQTDREREVFMKTFWAQRDPNPHTEENEFQIEHYKRMQYAEDHLGRGTPTAGWRTDMGRIYIILGEPNSIERYENMTQVYPIVVWFYQGLVKYGLPHAFSVVFFKQDGSGDYQLYSPVVHGPNKLLVHYTGDVNDYLDAYRKLYDVNPNIAKISLSLVEGEQNLNMRPSLSSDILIQKQIPTAPTRKVNDSYATKLLKYKEFIDIDYSVNFIPNSSMVRVIRDNDGFYFVHYLIEPKKLSLEQYDDDFFANLEVNGSILDQQDKIIYQFNKTVPIKLRKDQVDMVRGKLFSFQDMFPLIEGTYKVNVLIRNIVSKEFTSIEKTVTIPKAESENDTPRIGALTLAHTAKKDPTYRSFDKSFLIDDTQLLPSPRNDFVSGDTMYLYFQVHGLTDEQREKGHVVYTLYKNDKAFHTVKKNLSDYRDKTNIMESFSLEGYSAAYYNIRASLYAAGDRFLTLGEESFYITPINKLPRPWVVSLSTPAGSPENFSKLGIQYANNNNDKKALAYLQGAYNRNPLLPQVALDYARILNKLKMYEKLLIVGTPFMETDAKHKFYALMGIAAEGLEQYEKAVTYYKAYLSYYGTNLRILNSIGKCWLKLDNIDEALVALEKSLELFPNQDKLKSVVEALKKKKQEASNQGKNKK